MLQLVHFLLGPPQLFLQVYVLLLALLQVRLGLLESRGGRGRLELRLH